jgi:NADH-quinone oxidoreductase subunit N
MLVSAAMLLTALVADGYLAREGIAGAEFHVLALVSASGAILMGSANDLIIVFLGLEILSIALYVLTAFNHHLATSGEAALKYFILGGFSSAIFIYGIALTYGATGSTNLTQIADFLSKNVVLTNGLLLAGLALMLVGFAFKVAAVPFHMWTPDVYEGAPTPVTGFMAAVAKVGAFAALLRVLYSSLGVISADWKPIIYGLAVLSLVVGSVVALRQRDVKRMLAYSSINHAGFILLGVESATSRGVSSSLYYLAAYTFMTIGSFAIVTVLGRTGDGDHDLTRYRGLAQRQPLLALSFAILLLAQAGVPFTTGLWAKLQVVLATVSAGAVPLAVIAMVTAAIAAFFYLRVAVLMYVSEATGEGGNAIADSVPARTDAGGQIPWASPDGASGTVTTLNAELLLAGDAPAPTGEAAPSVVRIPALTWVAIAVCLAVTVVFGIVPGPLLDLANHATLLFVGH